MLNVPSQAFPAPNSQQRVSQSARNKVALKPGCSLMDWIRLTKSGKDLTGFRGRLIEVTEEELRKHNTRDDCWTCIRGMVYNVSPYMQFHPGGEDELLKAAGVDGTDLFDQVHRWVNYESMLKECLVGRMAAKPSTLIHGSSNTQKINPSVNRLYPSSPSTLLESNLPSSLLPPPTKDHCPRFDWFQTDVTVNITVYTKCKIPTSGITVVDLQGGTLRVEVFLGKLSYLLHLQLSHEVQEHLSENKIKKGFSPGRSINKLSKKQSCTNSTISSSFTEEPETVSHCIPVHTASAVGRVQVCMHKVSSGQWAKLGEPLESHDSFLHRKDCALFYRKCVLVSKTHVTHDTSVFHFQMPPGTVMQIPVGEHVYLKTTVKGNKVVKPYTPVDKILMPNSLESTEATADVFLMIKVYPDGVFTQHLCGLNIGDSLAISSPNGSFSLRPLHDITHLYLLAAGTGFTPMARLIRFTLHNVGNLRNTKLMFFNRQESDILWRSELDQLAEMEEKFEVKHVLSEPSDDWTGCRGRIDASLLMDFMSRPKESRCFVCICGPTPFTKLARGLVQQMGYCDEEIHTFLG
ncbi:cytochrome b5 reductase 4-like isoform X2 [Paramormyrops kingsleyae]|uniref:cytochrome b5 reductase 4 isoform X2 n=1 Tax=Paramormyrops kingsleyae TaxID=1676925 RepID=UPI003B972F8E